MQCGLESTLVECAMLLLHFALETFEEQQQQQGSEWLSNTCTCQTYLKDTQIACLNIAFVFLMFCLLCVFNHSTRYKYYWGQF